jgi:hypothetical protein
VGSGSGGDGAPGSDATGDAAGDHTAPGDSSTNADAPADADASAPLQLLTCTSWQLSTPTLIEKVFPSDSGGFGGGNGPIGQFAVEHVTGMNAARVVYETDTTLTTLKVATVSENTAGSLSSLSFTNRSLRGVQKSSSGVVVLDQNFTANQYEFYSMADTDPGTSASGLVGPSPTLSGALPSYGSSFSGNFEIPFLQLASGQMFVLATYTSTTAGSYNVASWLPGTMQWNLLLGPGPQMQLGEMVQDGTSAYAFLAPPGSGNSGPSAINQYTFSTTAATAPTSRSLMASGSTETAATIGAAPASGGGYGLAFVVLSGSQAASVRVGVVAQAQINSFLIDDLPMLPFNVQSDGGLFDTTPFSGRSGPGARWLSNGEVGMMGGGGTGGGGYTGLNFYVATTAGQWLVETAGTGHNLLAGQTIAGSSFDLSQSVSQILRRYDVAWLVQNSDGSSSLFFNVLNCML